MDKRKGLEQLPKNLNPEIAERVARHFKDGVFEFDFSTEESIATEGNTVYHVIPHYAGAEAESVLDKLRRIMAGRLKERESNENE